jgi:hypothetical protein
MRFSARAAPGTKASASGINANSSKRMRDMITPKAEARRH